MSLSQVESVLRLENPKTVRDVSLFIGFTNLYRRFIKKLSAIATLITELTKGNPLQFHWRDEQEAVFKKLKQLFTLAAVLYHFAPERESVIETYASD